MIHIVVVKQAEIAIESFRSSFVGESSYQKNNLLIASVRSGNVIGGGDWSENRIIPDLNKVYNFKPRNYYSKSKFNKTLATRFRSFIWLFKAC